MKLLLAFLRLTCGLVLGLALLELTLRANSTLLMRGMGAPAPVDEPVMVSRYTIRLSDADLYYWSPRLMRPIPPGEDRIEAEVRFETDEFGFPNAAPLPPRVDMVVLGRSFSLGAQAAAPWPRLFAEQSGWRVLNLSQAGSGADLKGLYLRRFGWLRQPRWVVVTVMPSLDVAGYVRPESLIVEQLPFSVEQSLARRLLPPADGQNQAPAIYPLAVDIPGRTVPLTFFYYYLSYLTIDRKMLMASTQWAEYTGRVLDLVGEANTHSACVALLYSPTKENIYFSLASDPAQLQAVRPSVTAYSLDPAGALVQYSGGQVDVPAMQANAEAGREAVASFARTQGLPLIDPTDAFKQAALAGEEPFMAYDTHWSALGHHLVAQAAIEVLHSAPCP
jgi:hypothetical protein